MTRHSYTRADFHSNQPHANCIFIYLDTGQALFEEIGLHVIGATLLKGNLCSKKKSPGGKKEKSFNFFKKIQFGTRIPEEIFLTAWDKANQIFSVYFKISIPIPL